MRRMTVEPRSDWPQKLVDLGLEFDVRASSPYWCEEAAYAFSDAQIETLETACAELVGMIDQAVDYVVANDRLSALGISGKLATAATASWKVREPSLYGRFDLRFDGQGPPKLLEYNSDTPTALFEASVVQWLWLEERYAALDQWNSIHEGLLETWAELRGAGLSSAHFACSPEDDDDLLTTAYLQDTATQAGLETRFLRLVDVGWDGQRFVDLEDASIEALFKLHPWDWLAEEAFFPHIAATRLRVVEPAWRVIPASKGILAILWELFPDHPNLLAASFGSGRIKGPVIRKPLFGREGANMVVSEARGLTVTDGPYGSMATMEQAFLPLPDFDGWRPVLGAWIIGGVARGMGIREDRALVTGRRAHFVPHVIE